MDNIAQISRDIFYQNKPTDFSLISLNIDIINKVLSYSCFVNPPTNHGHGSTGWVSRNKDRSHHHNDYKPHPKKKLIGGSTLNALLNIINQSNCTKITRLVVDPIKDSQTALTTINKIFDMAVIHEPYIDYYINIVCEILDKCLVDSTVNVFNSIYEKFKTTLDTLLPSIVFCTEDDYDVYCNVVRSQKCIMNFNTLCLKLIKGEHITSVGSYDHFTYILQFLHKYIQDNEKQNLLVKLLIKSYTGCEQYLLEELYNQKYDVLTIQSRFALEDLKGKRVKSC